MTAEMEPWPALAGRGQFVQTGRRSRVFLFDSGQGARGAPPIVLIHGLGDEADTWRHIFPLLAPRHRVIALDLPGFGRSRAAGRVNLTQCAESVWGVLMALGAGPSVLVGSSVGAVVAQRAAFLYSRMTRALICIDGGLPQAPGTFRPMTPMIVPFSGERIYTAFRADHDAAFASLRPYYENLDGLPQADRDFLRARVIQRVQSDTQRRAYFSLLRSLVLWGAFRSAYFRRGLTGFSKPLLLAWGTGDRIIPRATMDIIAAAALRARTVIIPGAGHLPQQERPDELAAVIRDFAARV